MTKKRKSINIIMSDAEIKEYQLRRRGRTHRELLLQSVGIDADPRLRGRPRFKFTKEPRQVGYKYAKDEEDKRTARRLKCENCGHSYETTQKPGGSVCERCKYHPKELGKKRFRMIKCAVCNRVYYTSRIRGSSFCWNCKNINTEIQPFVWKQPRTGVTRNKDATAMAYFAISQDEWDLLGEWEKLDYIYDLPGVDVKRSLDLQHEDFEENTRKRIVDEMTKKTREMAKDREDEER